MIAAIPSLLSPSACFNVTIPSNTVVIKILLSVLISFFLVSFYMSHKYLRLNYVVNLLKLSHLFKVLTTSALLN